MILNELIVESNELEDDSIIAEYVIGNNDYILLINSTTASKLNPGDIRTLLSTPIKGDPPLPLFN